MKLFIIIVLNITWRWEMFYYKKKFNFNLFCTQVRRNVRWIFDALVNERALAEFLAKVKNKITLGFRLGFRPGASHWRANVRGLFT